MVQRAASLRCGDAADYEQVRAGPSDADCRGAVDLLINNAAIINRNARLWEISAREFSEVIDVNIKGAANVIRHFVPSMVAAGSGTINFSSGWGMLDVAWR